MHLIAKELLPLSRKSFPHATMTQSKLLKRIRAARTLVFVMPSKRPQAFISYILESPDTMLIDMLAVSHSFKRKGIGTRLMKYAEASAQKKGRRLAYLRVDEYNHGGLSFYSKKGYQISSFNSALRCYILNKSL